MKSLITAAFFLLAYGANADDSVKSLSRHLREKVTADYPESTIQEVNRIQLAEESNHRKLSSWLSLLGLGKTCFNLI